MVIHILYTVDKMVLMVVMQDGWTASAAAKSKDKWDYQARVHLDEMVPVAIRWGEA
jgi:hypothetical protein